LVDIVRFDKPRFRVLEEGFRLIDEVKNRFLDADVACRLPYLLRLVGPLGLNQRPVGNGEQATVLLDKRPFPHPGIRDPLFPFDGNRSPLAEHVCRKRIKNLFQPVLYALPGPRLPSP